jgi:hypothetical protein
VPTDFEELRRDAEPLGHLGRVQHVVAVAAALLDELIGALVDMQSPVGGGRLG